MDMPWKPLPCHSGYFMMVDVKECRNLVPQSYFDSHEYDPEGDRPVIKVRREMPNGKIPLDLAFCRWMARENGVTMMPNSSFYNEKSPFMSEDYVRLAICKDLKSV